MDYPLTEDELMLGAQTIRGVAEYRGISEEEVWRQMEKVLECLLDDPDPKLQKLLGDIPRAGAEVNVEKFIAYVARLMKRWEEDHRPL